MPTLSLTGTADRSDGTTIVTQVALAPSIAVTEDAVHTVAIGAGLSHTLAMGQVTTASYVLISSTGQLGVAINGLTAIKGRTFFLETTEVTAIVLNNLSGTAAVTVRVILGGV